MEIINTINEINKFKCDVEYYVKDIQISIVIKDFIKITILNDAMKIGKNVLEFIIDKENENLIKNDIEGTLSRLDNICISKQFKKSVRVFNPFFTHKKVKYPKGCWRLDYIINAIGSKQIEAVYKYNSELEKNYLQNSLLFCKRIVEDPKGWWIAEDVKINRNKYKISVNYLDKEYYYLIFCL